MSTDAHEPVILESDGGDPNGVKCSHEPCHFIMVAGPNTEDFYRGYFAKQHGAQYEPGRAPDIEVDWRIEAWCSLCSSEVHVVDSDTIQCHGCDATWSMTGRHGWKGAGHE